jgi:ribonucleoside-diphosphate reductase alpha chain
MLNIAPNFCPDNVDPMETVEWVKRSASIQGDGGKIVFSQENIDTPLSWSDTAVNIVVSHYFYGDPKKPERETSIARLIDRVCATIADWGVADGYFNAADGQTFSDELEWLCLHQHASFNSPVWFNVGLHQQYGVKGGRHNWRWDGKEATQPDSYEYPQSAACFIQRVEDNMPSIMGLAADEAMLFKYGSGTGSSLNRLRATCEMISGGGKPSGPLSFMRIYDSVAGVVKSGGVTRRAALMHTLDIDHPDILDFIKSKQDEELKAKLLLSQGLSYEDVYETLAYQNVNISVRLSDEFMNAVKENKSWDTKWITDPSLTGPSYQARELFESLCKATWDCGDPGVQFDTTINGMHTCRESDRIYASNPCSEFMFLDDSACNLASINLTKFYKDGKFQVKRFQAACRLIAIAQDILVGRSSYPTADIAKRSFEYRPIGLGYSNLGSLLMLMGLPYASSAGQDICANITAIMCGTAYLVGTEMAEVLGPFERYPENAKGMMNVIANHWAAAQALPDTEIFSDSVQTLWVEVLRRGHLHGFRNAQATVLAPTGTISFMMDCSTTGIEPLTSLVTYKKLASGGVLELVDKNLPPVLRNLGYADEQITGLCEYVTERKEIAGAPALKKDHLPIFDCSLQAQPESRCIHWQGHVRMMAAAQKFISGAISKTVNVPVTCTPEEVGDIYTLGHQLGLKAIAVYRDRSKGIQPLSVMPQKEITVKPYRKRLPDTRESITHKFNVAGHEGFLTVGLYPDGDPGELFISMSKEGSTVGGLMDCLGVSISMGLQYGVPLDSFIEKFSHVRFEPQGITKNQDIRFAKSLVDYIFRWLEQTFDKAPGDPVSDPLIEMDEEVFDIKFQASAPACEHCGSITVRSGTCYVCKNCGNSLGCS